MKHDLPMLSVLSSPAYDNEVNRILESGMQQREMTELLGKLAMISSEISINDQGKLLIPKDLCERAGLVAEADVVLVGRWDHFEIWNKESFDRAQEIESRELQSDDLGIL
jgi:MraZ protein